MSMESTRQTSAATKYRKDIPISLTDRQWPSRRSERAPIWLSTDLRDGNQALMRPMTIEQKWRYYRMLVAIGFKQIEVSFPCASETEYNFTRALVETPGAIPSDVTIEVISPCRKDALKRTVESIRGAPNVILFTFLATSDNYQETIFKAKEEEMLERARTCTEYARSITKDDPIASLETNWSFGFGMEDFGNSRPEAALRLGEVVREAWGPTRENPVILGLATSVESFTPNVYADQVEFFARNISQRETVCISLHTHNDRGGAVASAELGCLAGADRVEGCLFGNGERAGNLDLVTMALNCLTQGIEPGLDLSQLSSIRQIYEEITGLPVHPRTPYSGDLYFRAWSGNHQDSIRKGLAKYQGGQTSTWKVPYLPLDPADVGQSFDKVIGINSQSGKAGVSWMLLQELGVEIPDELAAEFAKIVKNESDRLGRDLQGEELCRLFVDELALSRSGERLVVCGSRAVLDETDLVGEKEMFWKLSELLSVELVLVRSIEQSTKKPGFGEMAVFSKARVEDGNEVWGIGVGSRDTAAVRSVLSLLMRIGSLQEEHKYQPPSPVSLSQGSSDRGGSELEISL